MRFLFAVIADKTLPTVATHSEAVMIDSFNDKIESAGQRIMAAGIAAPSESKLYDNRDGLGHVSIGPAIDADLFMAGFWIIDVDDEFESEQLAMEASLACNRMIEVRPFL